MIKLEAQPHRLFMFALALCAAYLAIFAGSLLFYPKLPAPSDIRFHIVKKQLGSYLVAFPADKEDILRGETYKLKCLVGSEYRFFDLYVNNLNQHQGLATLYENTTSPKWKKGEDVTAVIFIRKKSKKAMFRLLFK